MSERRLVAVLGYSDGRNTGLHSVCAARLARAASEARPGDAVLLSGWARKRSTASEAELMARAWCVQDTTVVLDRRARSTLGNAVGAAEAARKLGVREIVLVTSGWHARRAGVLLRAAAPRSGFHVLLAGTDERGTIGARLRELACWTLVPFQAVVAGRRM